MVPQKDFWGLQKVMCHQGKSLVEVLLYLANNLLKGLEVQFLLQGTKHCRGFWGHVPTALKYLNFQSTWNAIFCYSDRTFELLQLLSYLYSNNKQTTVSHFACFFIKRKLFAEAEIYFTFQQSNAQQRFSSCCRVPNEVGTGGMLSLENSKFSEPLEHYFRHCGRTLHHYGSNQ